MDSGNSGSISSSGDEEYDSRADHTLLPPSFLNQPTPQFGASLVSSSHHHQTHHPHHPSFFDLSSSYLHALSQSHPHSNPNSFPNLDTAAPQGRRSEPDCTDTAGGVASSSPPINQSLLAPHHHQGYGQCVTDPSLQLRSVVHDDNSNSKNARVVLSSSPTTNVARNSKKRTRASRRAPTTVLTTDTSNFRAMVQEFTGIPAPPFSGGSSYSRRLDLLTASSSLRSSSSHLDTSCAFYPLRPSPQKLHHHPSSLLLSSSSPPSPSTLLHNNNMVDAIASTANNNSSSNNSNSVNYQLPPDLGLPYNHHPQNIMLSMQNHPILAFHPPPQPQSLHPFGTGGFGAKSQAGLSVQSLEDLGVSQGQVNVHLVGGGVSVPTGHGHVMSSEGMTLRCASEDGGGGGSVGGSRRDGSYNGGKVAASSAAGGGGGGSCKLNFSASASGNLNHDKTLENNNNSSSRGEGAVDSWICSSD